MSAVSESDYKRVLNEVLSTRHLVIESDEEMHRRMDKLRALGIDPCSNFSPRPPGIPNKPPSVLLPYENPSPIARVVFWYKNKPREVVAVVGLVALSFIAILASNFHR